MAQATLRLRREDEKPEPFRTKFTKRELNGVQAPAEGQTWLYDTECPGLALLVSPSGSKRFYFCGRVAGRYKRKALGEYPSVGIDAAREAARVMAGEKAKGDDPFAKRRAAGTGMTFGALCERWIQHARAHKRTADEDERRIKRHLSAWKLRRVSNIERDDIVRLHRKIGEAAPYEANRTLMLLSAMFKEAIKAKAIDESPTKGVKAFAEQRRDRYLDEYELPRFLDALDAEPSETARHALWLLLLTAQRASSVLSMRWADIDMGRRVWTIERTKAGNVHEVPLCKRAVAILRLRQRHASGKYVLPGSGRTGHFTEALQAVRRVCKRAKIQQRLRVHDLRRCWTTWSGKAGVHYLAVKRALDHSTAQDVTARYFVVDMPMLRAAFEDTAAAMLATQKGGKR